MRQHTKLKVIFQLQSATVWPEFKFNKKVNIKKSFQNAPKNKLDIWWEMLLTRGNQNNNNSKQHTAIDIV